MRLQDLISDRLEMCPASSSSSSEAATNLMYWKVELSRHGDEGKQNLLHQNNKRILFFYWNKLRRGLQSGTAARRKKIAGHKTKINDSTRLESLKIQAGR